MENYSNTGQLSIDAPLNKRTLPNSENIFRDVNKRPPLARRRRKFFRGVNKRTPSPPQAEIFKGFLR